MSIRQDFLADLSTTAHSFLTYVVADNLYDGAISEVLPRWDFTFLAEDKNASFDLDATAKSDDCDYILEVDLKYPEHAHDSHSYYLLAAKNLG